MTLPTRPEARPIARPGPLEAIGFLALLVAAPVLTWAAVGDLSEAGATDYALPPPEVSPATGTTIVGVAALVAVAGVWLLVRPHGVVRRVPMWWLVVVPLVLVAVGVGLAGRVITAAVVGANIGAGLMVILGGPLAVAVLVWSVIWSVVLVRRHRWVHRP